MPLRAKRSGDLLSLLVDRLHPRGRISDEDDVLLLTLPRPTHDNGAFGEGIATHRDVGLAIGLVVPVRWLIRVQIERDGILTSLGSPRFAVRLHLLPHRSRDRKVVGFG